MILFLLWCLVSIQTPYDMEISDRAQEEFLKKYKR